MISVADESGRLYPGTPLVTHRAAGLGTILISPVAPERNDRLGRVWVVARASERQLVAEAALELGDPAERVQLGDVLFAAEGPEHTGEVAGGGNRGAEPST